MRIALYQPDIAGNVGAILRTAACLGLGVDLSRIITRSNLQSGIAYAAEHRDGVKG